MDLKQKQCDCTDKCLGYLTKTCTRKEKQKRLLFNIMKSDEELGLYEKPKQEALEEAAKRYTEIWFKNYDYAEELFIQGAEWQYERMYTEEDLRQAYNYGMFAVTSGRNFKDWFTNYKSK